MSEGSVQSIHITAATGEPPASVKEANLVAGKGLTGDRYYGTKPDSQATLIEAEAIDALEADHGLKLAYGDARRNIVTRGVALAELVDREFQVGAVRLRGVRLSEPCAHLAELTDQRVLKGLMHRAGIKVEILNDGVIQVGDSVQTA